MVSIGSFHVKSEGLLYDNNVPSWGLAMEPPVCLACRAVKSSVVPDQAYDQHGTTTLVPIKVSMLVVICLLGRSSGS